MAKEIKKGRWRETRKYADRDHLGDRLKATPADILLRNGRLDVLHFKGAFCHLHRLDEALSRFENVSVLESLLENGGTNQGLSERNGDYLSPAYSLDSFLHQDVVVLDNVPASGMSLQSRINTQRFVEAGEGLLLIGGWYTLDKGEFEGSLLEDILPCETLQWHSLVKPDVLERAKLYAVARNPKNLPWLKKQRIAVLAKEHFFATKRPAKDAPWHLLREQGIWWIRHPFLAGAAFRFGGGPNFAYEHARGVYHLFFYAWRERWVIEGETSAGWDETEEQRHLRMRRAARAPYRLAMFHREAANAFEMLLEDFEKLKPEALRAMKEIDCHKTMPAVYRLFARLKADDWPVVSPLVETSYEPVHNVALHFVLRHGGEEGRKQVSERLLALAKRPPPANSAFVLKRLSLIAETQRMPLLLEQLRTGEATAFEAALRAALALPAEQKLQAISVAGDRQDFFAKRLQEAYGIRQAE